MYLNRIYKAQQEGDNFDTPETEYLTFETLDHMGLSKVSIINRLLNFLLSRLV